MKSLVVMPTYNESVNLPIMAARLFDSVPDAELLVVDDNSPDGTGAIADQLAAADIRVHVLHRLEKNGLGAAYRAGFAWGLERGYDLLIEMDADGSHQASHLPAMLSAITEADLVIGSRWTRGGSVVNWPWHRKVLSVGGNLYARLLLGLRINDATAGYRVFRKEAVERIGLLAGESTGYVFQIDSSFRAARAGLRVVEVPIEFIERVNGVSKMSRAIVLEAMWQVTLWAWRHRVLRQPLV